MNAKEEFLQEVKCANSKVLCAKIQVSGVEAILPKNYTEEQYQEFLNKLDLKYNEGYGGQNLFGNIWFENKSWAERGEYDGSEWWEIPMFPKIPKECE